MLLGNPQRRPLQHFRYEAQGIVFSMLMLLEASYRHCSQICMFRAQGSPEAMNEAIKALNEYLLLFPTDADAWREMADIYLDLQQIEQAKFALEEVVMLSPINYVSHLKLAEALYTLGDHSTARK
jgi:cytochrome c-type biogenesis protein CcmH/NrfG